MRTEHNGAKRGKGFWGRKQEAKSKSNKVRRHESKNLISNYENYFREDEDDQVS